MTTLVYGVAPEVFALCPGYVRGVLVFDRLDNSTREEAALPLPASAGNGSETVQLLAAAQQLARAASPGNVAELPRIAAWRDAYRRFGAKPSEHRSSIESLLRRAQKPDALPAINALVDIGNIVSLRHGLPAGMHPLSGADAVLELRVARAGDTFLAPDGGPAEPVTPPEVVLASGSKVLTRRWTWRQSAESFTLAATTRVFLNVDGLPPVSRRDVEAAMDDAGSLVRRLCGGERVSSFVLDAVSPRATVVFTDRAARA